MVSASEAWRSARCGDIRLRPAGRPESAPVPSELLAEDLYIWYIGILECLAYLSNVFVICVFAIVLGGHAEMGFDAV